MIERWEVSELVDKLQEHNGLDVTTVHDQWVAHIDRILARGDRWLVYENQNLGSGDVGLLWGCSYGSAEAQIEEAQYPEPPEKCPDFGGYPPMWAYRLVAEVVAS